MPYGNMTVSQAVSEYARASRHKSPNTQRLLLFSSWCETQGLTLETITARAIRDFLDFVSTRPGMHTEHVKSSTVRDYGKSVKSLINWAAKEEEYNVSSKIADRVTLPRAEQTVIETFTPEQIRDLFEACEKQPFAVRDKAILSVLLDTGVRASELCGLTVDAVWLDNDDSFIRVVNTKSKRDREIGLGRTARIALRRYITRYRKPTDRAEPHVFIGGHGLPLTRSGLHTLIANIGSMAHIQGIRVSPHTMRHTFAVQYLLNNGDVYKLSRLMGHADIRVTTRYLQSMKAKQVRAENNSVLD